MTATLLEMRGLRREFPAGEGTVAVLKDIDLCIEAGEMVAIVGASGSGKSTLMDILGCLDCATSGSYRIAGRDVSTLSPDELAGLRRERFGFIFQRYHLLDDLPAVGNVALPAVYAGQPAEARQARAQELLTRLDLADRMLHRPAQLSGGQQQRVSIARALMNGGTVVLADEPTGALDKASGQEVMQILQELHAGGRTVILITHDMNVAAYAERVIELSDGVIVADRRSEGKAPLQAAQIRHTSPGNTAMQGWGHRMAEALQMAVRALDAHRLRSFLTMLGIVIGIAAVVFVVALGRGAQDKVLAQIGTLGTNTLEIYPGREFGDLQASAIDTLVPADVQALAAQAYVDSATPSLSVAVTARYQQAGVSAQINGVGAGHFPVWGLQLSAGRFFDERDIGHSAQVVVIDHKAARALFPFNPSPLGETVLLGSMPAEVIGVLAPETHGAAGPTPTFLVPYTSVYSRLGGKHHLDSIILRISDSVPVDAAKQAAIALLTERHGRQDFFIYDSDQIRQAVGRTGQVLTLLISSIAGIALLVGGVGVMNIMLVSVTERTREIGVRMAIGARQSDILQQFLIEAVMVCLIGGLLGILLALGLGALVAVFNPQWQLPFTTGSIVWAVASSSLIGICFGFLPARAAARLNPVQALARD
ncbi:MacB family efflux pump subunit [Comamonas piscis]